MDENHQRVATLWTPGAMFSGAPAPFLTIHCNSCHGLDFYRTPYVGLPQVRRIKEVLFLQFRGHYRRNGGSGHKFIQCARAERKPPLFRWTHRLFFFVPRFFLEPSKKKWGEKQRTRPQGETPPSRAVREKKPLSLYK